MMVGEKREERGKDVGERDVCDVSSHDSGRISKEEKKREMWREKNRSEGKFEYKNERKREREMVTKGGGVEANGNGNMDG